MINLLDFTDVTRCHHADVPHHSLGKVVSLIHDFLHLNEWWMLLAVLPVLLRFFKESSAMFSMMKYVFNEAFIIELKTVV